MIASQVNNDIYLTFILFFNFIFINIYVFTGKLYNNATVIEERHRHRYEINPDYITDLEAAGLKFVGKLLQFIYLSYRFL